MWLHIPSVGSDPRPVIQAVESVLVYILPLKFDVQISNIAAAAEVPQSLKMGEFEDISRQQNNGSMISKRTKRKLVNVVQGSPSNRG